MIIAAPQTGLPGAMACRRAGDANRTAGGAGFVAITGFIATNGAEAGVVPRHNIMPMTALAATATIIRGERHPAADDMKLVE